VIRKAVEPTCQGNYGEVEWLYDMGHCTNRLSVLLADNNIIWLVRIFAPYGRFGRIQLSGQIKSALLHLQHDKEVVP
jgi:hypothetical protein